MPFPTLTPTELLTRLAPPEGRVTMVLDTDTYNEIDDQFALVYSLLSPDKLDVRAVYAAPFHNDRSTGPADGMEKSHREILTLLDKLRESGVTARPDVCRGATRWLSETGTPVESEATEHLLHLIEQQPEGGPLYVVAIGAITNVASAILLKPEILTKIVVVWLAGHPHTYHHTEEFNLRQDITASRVVLDCGVPLALMPCVNVAEHLLLTREDVKNRLDGRGAIGTYLASEFLQYADDCNADSRSIWDMTPIAYLLAAGWVETALIPAPILTTSSLQAEPYGTPLLGNRRRPDTQHREHCTWSLDPRRHFIREASRLHRDAIFRDFFAKIEAR